MCVSVSVSKGGGIGQIETRHRGLMGGSRITCQAPVEKMHNGYAYAQNMKQTLIDIIDPKWEKMVTGVHHRTNLAVTGSQASPGEYHHMLPAAAAPSCEREASAFTSSSTLPRGGGWGGAQHHQVPPPSPDQHQVD